MSEDMKPRRILVIDDSEAIHTDFLRILGREQKKERDELDLLEEALFGTSPSRASAADEGVFEVDSAFQGQQGVEKIREAQAAGRPYALVFLDYRMPPGWNGAETLRRLREVAPQLPVVLCSAYSDYAWAEALQDSGQPELLKELRKPFNGQDLRQLALTLTQP